MKCPTCFAHLQGRPLKLVCQGSCDPEVDAQASSVRGFEVTTKTVFDAPAAAHPDAPVSAACPRCRVTSSVEACGYCAAPVPPNWRAATVTCIAMAGARATGKSLMLAVAKEQLALLVERHHQSALLGVGSSDQVFRNNYTVPLYEQRRLLQATASASNLQATTRESLVFHFTERHRDGSSRTRIIVLRDVAGEDLEALGGMDHSLSFFSRADAVIALLDPLTVPQVRHMLADLIPTDTRLGGDGISVLRHVLSLMTQRAPGARTSIPLAVVLSKVDTLQQLREVKGTTWSRIMNRPGGPLMRDPSMRQAGFDRVDGGLLHEEVVGLLEMLNASTLTAMLRDTSDNFHYFAVSALGASPRGDVINAGGIAPFRVIDPFKWALDVTG